MSRIIVKQLPKNISEEKLRNIFGTKGTITDLQLKYTPDGKFRQFCFIGYSSEQEALEAIKHFDNSCVQTSRIRVETCAALGSEQKPQSWSKYAKDSKQNLDKLKAAEQPSKEKKKTKEQKSKKVDEILNKHKDDPEFQEFLQAHDKSRALWANDAGITNENQDDTDTDINKEKSSAISPDHHNDSGLDDGKDEDEDEPAAASDDSEAEKLAERPISDLQYMQSLMAGQAKAKSESKKPNKEKKEKSDLELFTIKIHNVPYKTKRQEVLKFFKPLKPFSVRLPAKVHGFCYVGFKTEKDMAKAMLKNKSFIKGKQVFFSDFTAKNKVTKARQSGANTNENDGAGASGNAKWQQQEKSLQAEENISESGRIFFRNLAYTTTEDDLQKLFEKFGPLVEVQLPVDQLTRRIKGFGTVTFMMPEHALQAFNQLDGTDFHGRLLHLLPGKDLSEQEKKDDNLEDDAGLTFKQKKALKLKKAAQQGIGWNTLFLGPNTVADLLAKQFKTSKEKILDTTEGGSNAAVRLALGETQIVIEMKKFLETEGVRLSAFDELATPKAKRSKTVIIAKNLPAATESTELSPIFAKFGPIGRIVLPPSGVTALIEFCDPSEARQAFKKLAYSKFKNIPLFLEWAPEGVFTKSPTGEQLIAKNEMEEEQQPPSKDNNKEQEVQNSEQEGNEENDDDEEPESNTTLFLRNLNFKTVQQTVYDHFKRLGRIHTVEIAKKKDPSNPRVTTSLGYGFIQFKQAAVADQALKTMQLTHIDGNPVELKRSDRILKTNTSRRQPTKEKKQTGSKILVRNIPFQAHHSEVRELFKAFGELRSMRIPKKMAPGQEGHRGFGFVDFVQKNDAKQAMEALGASTHLYGRRLVLEWASRDEDLQDIAELRKRTAEKFDGGASSTLAPKSKRAFFDVEGNIQQPEGEGDDDDDNDNDKDDEDE